MTTNLGKRNINDVDDGDHKPLKKGAKVCKPIESCKIGNDTQVWTWHESVKAASKDLTANQGAISNVLAGRKKSAGGHIFRWAETDHILQLNGEEWRSATLNNEPLKNWFVSNMGRTKNPFNVISYGCKDDGMRIRCNGKLHYVHVIIMHTFIGPPPADMTSKVEHIDKDYCNNRLDNLRWAK